MKPEKPSEIVSTPAEASQPCACTEKDYLIQEEVEALARLRGIKAASKKEKARLEEMRQRLNLELPGKDAGQISPEEKVVRREQQKLQEEIRACEQRMEQLKLQWDEWDQKRKQANKEKWIRLGYPDF